MKRRLFKLGFFVLFGAIINVAVAWLCLAAQELPLQPALSESAQQMWDRYANRSHQHGAAQIHHVSGAIGCDFIILDASTYRADEAAPPRMMITRGGIPLRAVEAMHSWGPVTPRFSWGIPITPRRPNVSWLSVLPCRPLWPGFVINSALFGGMLFGAVAFPRLLVRLTNREYRMLQGRCVACGYDLRGARHEACPECGKPVTVAEK